MTDNATNIPTPDPFAPPRRLSVLQDEPLSVSRIRRDDQCPNAFRLTYVDKVSRHPDMLDEFTEELLESSRLGTVCHAAIESAYREALALGQGGTLPEAEATRHYRAAFIESNLRDEDAYAVGLAMVRSYFERNPIVVERLIPQAEGGGVERKFLLRAGEFYVLGYIDLIERMAPGHYRVTDHKSGKWLFTDEDIERDLQLGVYGWAVRQLFPDAERVDLQFEMLRHHTVQRAERTPEQCVDAVRYLVDRARQIETRTEFPAVLGTLCSWCSVRHHCEPYGQAHDPEMIDRLIGLVATDDIDAVSRARATAFGINKITEKRYKALDKVIMAKLDAMGVDTITTDDGWRYTPTQKTTNSYDLDKIRNAFKQAGIEEPKVDSFVKVTKKDLDAYIESLDGVTGAKKKMLKATISAQANSKKSGRFVSARQGKK